MARNQVVITKPNQTIAQVVELQKQWYNKLKQTGFVDIETGDMLIHNKQAPRTDSKSKMADQLNYETTIAYYDMADEYLTTCNWSSAQEKAIWEAHTQGASYRNIALQLKTKVHKVMGVIKHHEHIMLKGAR